MDPMYRISAAGLRIDRLFTFLILISLLLTACTPAPTAAVPGTPVPETPIQTETIQPVETATPEPELDRVILVANQPQPEAESLLQDLAQQNGMQLEVLAGIQPEDIQSNWKIMVFLPAPENISQWTAAGPGTQFVVSSDAELPATPNLSVIRSLPEHLAFAAGYIGAAITPDWRIAGLLPSDTALGENLPDAFQNGGYYYCGLCRTLYAPFVRWPVTGTLPTGSDLAAWQSAVAELEPSVVYGMYIDARIGSTELVNWLSGKDIVLLGGETPPAEVLPRWAVTIRPDIIPALENLMPTILEGSGGQVVSANLELIDINPRLLSPGRLRLIETMLDDLAAGMIEPFTISQ
jgi:hypothetical protein